MAIEIIKFRSYEKNTLKGFFACRLTNVGIELRDLSLHQKNGKRWVSLPAKPYEKEDGSQGWSYLIKFYDEARAKQFQKTCLEALDKFKNKEGVGNGANKRN